MDVVVDVKLFERFRKLQLNTNFQISSVIRKELCAVDWDSELKAEMEMNALKAIELTTQKIEQNLVLDEESLRIGERISNAQVSGNQ